MPDKMVTKKKLLFSHSYFYRFDEKQWNMRQPFPPLMTITAAALLEKNGFDVDLFDVGLASGPELLIQKLDDVHPDYFIIFDDGFNYLTKMCLTIMREAAFVMQQYAKDRNITVITCSSDATDHYEKYLANGADYVIRGEGENALLQLLKVLDEGKIKIDVPGITYWLNDTLVKNKRAEVLRDLDNLPLAAWHLVDIGAYREIWHMRNAPHYINIATTRGCPFKCNWCAKPIYGNRYNSRSPEHVVDEIEYHVEIHGIHHFWMCDDIFGLRPGWIEKFRDELIRRGLRIRYKIQSRADLLLEENTIESLVDSGLDEVWIGAESGSQKVLDSMDKGITISQIEMASKILKENGVKVAFFIQYGYPGETKADIKMTLKMIQNLLPENLGISVSYPLPGTKFYEKVKADLSKKANWKDSDDLDMMFQNVYPSEFYTILHRYTHLVYNIEKGVVAVKKGFYKPGSINRKQILTTMHALFYVPIAILKRVRLSLISKQLF